jgi:putative transposase
MPPIRPELLDELLKDYRKPDDLLGQDGLLQQLTKALVERALDGELTHHLGYEKHDAAGDNSGNSRNGTSPKTLRGKRGQVQIDVPRDRASEFEPQLVKKNQTRFDGHPWAAQSHERILGRILPNSKDHRHQACTRGGIS